jgi:hypothetical protein
VKLTLEHVSFHEVSFTVELADGSERLVEVLVGSGSSWPRAVRFPHIGSEAGESLGDSALDDEVRRRAAEELVRLASAVDAASGARCAA